MNQLQITDVEEAKIMLSMKNDEVRSLTNKMKMLEKKSNIKIAESNYQVQQEKNKLLDMEKKMDKLKETQKLQLNKFYNSEQALKGEITKLKQNIVEMQKNERQLQRSHKAQIYEYDLSLQELKEKNHSLLKEIVEIHKIFNPEEIIKQMQLKSISQIPPYLKIKSELNQKTEEIAVLNHTLEQYKSTTFQAMQESFSKLNSYEDVMSSLRKKNEELQEIMAEKQKDLQSKHIQLQEKESFIAKVEAVTAEKYYEMSDQIQNLRMSVQKYERQSINYQQSKQEHENNLKFIFELSSEFEQKEDDYLQKISQLQNAFHTSETQKNQIIEEYQTIIQDYRDQLNKYENDQKRNEDNLKNKDDIISMLTNSLKQLETQLQSIKKQLEKSKIQINELIRRKHKLQEELKQNQNLHKVKEQSLMEELQLVKTYRHRSGDSYEQKNQYIVDETAKNSEDITFKTSSSLQDQIDPEPNWLQAYENALQKQNSFVRQVHYMLRKHIRKESFSMEG